MKELGHHRRLRVPPCMCFCAHMPVHTDEKQMTQTLKANRCAQMLKAHQNTHTLERAVERYFNTERTWMRPEFNVHGSTQMLQEESRAPAPLRSQVTVEGFGVEHVGQL